MLVARCTLVVGLTLPLLAAPSGLAEEFRFTSYNQIGAALEQQCQEIDRQDKLIQRQSEAIGELRAELISMKSSSAHADAALAPASYGCCDSACHADPCCGNGCCDQFSGWHVGGNVGWTLQQSTWNDNDSWVDNFSFDFATTSRSYRESGLNLGASIGYDWQHAGAVIGLVVDGNWTNLEHNTVATPSAFVGTTTLTMQDSVKFWGTVRGRAGVAVGSIFLYGTAGVAFADIEHQWTVTDGNIPAMESFRADSFRWGGVAGMGVEGALNDSWSLRYEALFVYFVDDETSGFSTQGIQTVNFVTQDSLLVQNLSLVYRWK